MLPSRLRLAPMTELVPVFGLVRIDEGLRPAQLPDMEFSRPLSISGLPFVTDRSSSDYQAIRYVLDLLDRQVDIRSLTDEETVAELMLRSGYDVETLVPQEHLDAIHHYHAGRAIGALTDRQILRFYLLYLSNHPNMGGRFIYPPQPDSWPIEEPFTLGLPP